MKKLRKFKLPIIYILLIIISSACLNNSNTNPTNTDLGSISGRLYFDEDSNQICDCDCGIEDVKIRLYQNKCSGTFQQTVISNEDGYYNFSDLKPGNYCVQPDISFSCEGYFPTSGTSRDIVLEANQDVMVEWLSYELYYKLDN